MLRLLRSRWMLKRFCLTLLFRYRNGIWIHRFIKSASFSQTKPAMLSKAAVVNKRNFNPLSCPLTRNAPPLPPPQNVQHSVQHLRFLPNLQRVQREIHLRRVECAERHEQEYSFHGHYRCNYRTTGEMLFMPSVVC